MKQKDLPTAEFLNRCFSYHPGTGELIWRERPEEHFSDGAHAAAWNAKYAGTIAGWRQNTGHLMVSAGTAKYLVHRVIWKMMTGRDPEREIDHANGARDDNRWRNLREATASENLTNRRTRNDCKTGLKGTRKLPGGRFGAHIRQDGRFVHLGTFATVDEAHRAFCNAAARIHGEFFNPGYAK